MKAKKITSPPCFAAKPIYSEEDLNPSAEKDADATPASMTVDDGDTYSEDNRSGGANVEELKKGSPKAVEAPENDEVGGAEVAEPRRTARSKMKPVAEKLQILSDAVMPPCTSASRRVIARITFYATNNALRVGERKVILLLLRPLLLTQIDMSTGSRRALSTLASPAGPSARPALRAININASAQKVEVDNGISLHYYYRIADNLLRQASVYREEKSIIDLYIILLRFSRHCFQKREQYLGRQVLLFIPRTVNCISMQKLLGVMDELEALKPVVQQQLVEINRGYIQEADGEDYKAFDSASVRKQLLSSSSTNQSSVIIRQSLFASASYLGIASLTIMQEEILFSQVLQKHGMARNEVFPSDKLLDIQLKKMSLNFPHPKEETLSRHSILGPNGLRGQWTGPISGIRVQYPKSFDLTENQMPGLNIDEAQEPVTLKESDLNGRTSDMEYVLSLNDGRWPVSGEESCSLEGDAIKENIYKLNIRQPSVPPVHAQVQQVSRPISPLKVADPRPGPPKLPQDGMTDYKTYQNLHPVQMLELFLKVAEANTLKNLETCGVLAGLLKNRMFFVTMLIIPKQESTSDSKRLRWEEVPLATLPQLEEVLPSSVPPAVIILTVSRMPPVPRSVFVLRGKKESLLVPSTRVLELSMKVDQLHIFVDDHDPEGAEKNSALEEELVAMKGASKELVGEKLHMETAKDMQELNAVKMEPEATKELERSSVELHVIFSSKSHSGWRC
ncbi:AMSH-like ubiquitin thioesterase 3 [Apostasia shenzhenica]|uniref:AMSH-like ubiquitin thioesterase 3 n=1 Tax=Apostasia shenzhenica TaxID=1088818 RepID=A0A2I0AHH5_9ASPA|nr:AMSH-like ubiquitin thioesterase 3 [Apostasia shenzhenica]